MRLIRALRFNAYLLFVVITALTHLTTAADSNSRKLDEGTDGSVKCTSCTQSPPPPSPPPPCPPPPPPPAPKKPPSTKNCPPPPPSYIFITGPPGNLYPIDTDFNGVGRSSVVKLPVVVVCGLLMVLGIW